MIFLQENTPYLLTESGYIIATEQYDELMRESADSDVVLIIPTVRTAEDGVLTLTVEHEVSKEEFTFETVAATIKTYKVVATFNVNAEMPTGQYRYVLRDTRGELQRGLLQVGLEQPEIKQYQQRIEVKSYEGQ